MIDVQKRYRTVIGSDPQRDGMYLELWERKSDVVVLEAFYSDVDGSMEFTHYREDVPAEVQSWFEQEARRRLPPAPT
jgi:hypothetical protein